jgi:hypothetical protein
VVSLQDILQQLCDKELDVHNLPECISRDESATECSVASLLRLSSSIRSDLTRIIGLRKEYLTHCEVYHAEFANLCRSLDAANMSADASQQPDNASLQTQLNLIKVYRIHVTCACKALS